MLRLVKKYKSGIIVALIILGGILIYVTNKDRVDALVETFILPGTFIGWIKYFSTIAFMDFVFFNPFSPDIIVTWFVEQLVPEVSIDFYIIDFSHPFSSVGYWLGELLTTLTPRMKNDLLLTAGIGALGSTAGALAGYGMGILVSGKKRRLLHWFLNRFGGSDLEKARKRINRIGMLAIAFAILPLVPFGPACWAAGMVRVRLVPFILICLIGRFLRFLIMGPAWAWGVI